MVVNKVSYPNYIAHKMVGSVVPEEEIEGLYYRTINKINYSVDIPWHGDSENISYYETHECKIEPDDIVYDCGASLGLFSIYASTKAKKVFAFEKDEELMPYLTNSNDYCYNDTSTFRAILGDHTDKVGGIIALDDIAEIMEAPTFIKINVEGNEVEVFNGMKKCIEKYKPKIAISIHHFDEYERTKRMNYFMDNLPEYAFKIQNSDMYDPVLICKPAV